MDESGLQCSVNQSPGLSFSLLVLTDQKFSVF